MNEEKHIDPRIVCAALDWVHQHQFLAFHNEYNSYEEYTDYLKQRGFALDCD